MSLAIVIILAIAAAIAYYYLFGPGKASGDSGAAEPKGLKTTDPLADSDGLRILSQLRDLKTAEPLVESKDEGKFKLRGLKTAEPVAEPAVKTKTLQSSQLKTAEALREDDQERRSFGFKTAEPMPDAEKENLLMAQRLRTIRMATGTRGEDDHHELKTARALADEGTFQLSEPKTARALADDGVQGNELQSNGQKFGETVFDTKRSATEGAQTATLPSNQNGSSMSIPETNDLGVAGTQESAEPELPKGEQVAQESGSGHKRKRKKRKSKKSRSSHTRKHRKHRKSKKKRSKPEDMVYE
ncbi:hypothetical protein Tcan_14871 [Toxocara canis]|uniref:Uncharacterized protein n=1 Tax=Toxocara canis TaxID=6265 RepID=A0A0B2VIA2_TOXCA|nr:hypothetical protein Tcan_14871 [Toxocara canis]